MRIFFLTTNDRIFLPYFFENAFSRINYKIAGLAIVDNPNFKKFLKNSFFFMGPSLFGREVIYQLGIRFKCLYKSIFSPSQTYSIKSVCKKFGVLFSSVNKVNSKMFRSYLKSLDIDVLVSVACPQILRKKILGIPHQAAVNVHYGMLPFYGGLYPSFWVLAQGEKYTGVSIHYMVEKVDTGDILVQLKEEILPDDTFYSLVKRLKTTIGPRALVMALDKINADDIEVIKNCPEKGSYFSFPTKNDMARFKSIGRKWR